MNVLDIFIFFIRVFIISIFVIVFTLNVYNIKKFFNFMRSDYQIIKFHIKYLKFDSKFILFLKNISQEEELTYQIKLLTKRLFDLNSALLNYLNYDSVLDPYIKEINETYNNVIKIKKKLENFDEIYELQQQTLYNLEFTINKVKEYSTSLINKKTENNDLYSSYFSKYLNTKIANVSFEKFKKGFYSDAVESALKEINTFFKS